jgi:hypothetical protein
MKIIRINLLLLRNEEWFQFMTEVRDLIQKFTAQTLLIEELFTQFLERYADADTALEIIRKSPETANMDKADQLRDQTFSGLTAIVRASLNHFDPKCAEAASRLLIVFNSYGNLAQKAPNEETAAIYNLLQELRGAAYSRYINRLQLTDWVDELDMRNADFRTLVRLRNEETAARPKLQLKKVRQEQDSIYRQMVERIESAIIIYGPEAYTPFVEQLNAFAERYNRVIAQRQGQRKANSNKAKTETTEN